LDESNIIIPFSVNIDNCGCRNSNVFDQDGVLTQTRWTCYVIHGVPISIVFFSWHYSSPWRARASSLSRPHDHRHTTIGRTLWTSDQFYTEASTWQNTTLTTSMPPEGFEPAIPADSRLRLRGHWHRLHRIIFLKPKQF